MIGIHPIHRRLAKLIDKAESIGGMKKLSSDEQIDLYHCLIVNAKIVRKMDDLKMLAFIAHRFNDMEWQQEICKEIDDLEVSMI